MPSEFANQFAETSWPLMLERFGESAAYSIKGATPGTPPIAITAIIERRPVDREYNDQGRGDMFEAMVKVATSDVAVPKRGDVIAFDGKDWTLNNTDPSDGAGYTVCLVRVYDQDIISGGMEAAVR